MKLDRTQRLARRVGWLDRHRRTLSILFALIVTPLLMLQLSDVLGEDLSHLYPTLLGLVVGFVLWAGAEIALAWITAVWDTEHAQLLRSHGLPRAVIRKP